MLIGLFLDFYPTKCIQIQKTTQKHEAPSEML